MTALLIRRRRPIGEPATLQPGSTPGAFVHSGSAGAGRVLHSLWELGRRFPTVVQSVHDLDSTATDIAALDVGRLFEAVILGSHLVNVPDPDLRRAFLDAARRHLVGDCDVLVEHHPIDWAETAAETRPTPGSTVGMAKVRRDPPFVSAVSTYDLGGRWFEQPFRARVLSEAELAEELAAAGLIVRQRLGPTWLVAGPSPREPGRPSRPPRA